MANQILGLIARTFVSRDKNIVLTLYKTLVRPHLDYCIQAWRPYLIKAITKLEKVQRKATRMVEGLKDLSYEERLKRLNLTTLETRRIRADMLEVYIFFTGWRGWMEISFSNWIVIVKQEGTGLNYIRKVLGQIMENIPLEIEW